MNAREEIEALLDQIPWAWTATAKREETLDSIRAILAAHELVPVGNLSESDRVAIGLSQESERLRAELAALKEQLRPRSGMNISTLLDKLRPIRKAQEGRVETAIGILHEFLTEMQKAKAIHGEIDAVFKRRPSLEWLQKWRGRAAGAGLRAQKAEPQAFDVGMIYQRAKRLLRRIDRRIKEARG